jgi:hypothetical protein
MQRRRIRPDSGSGSLAPTLAVGLSLGLAAGFLLGEFFAGHAPAAVGRWWSARGRGRRSPADLALDLRDRLEQALGPDGQSIEMLPVGRGAVEVHGWVTSRLARSRALRLAREALGPDIRLVDSLLVWGEDDRAPAAPARPGVAPAAAERDTA